MSRLHDRAAIAELACANPGSMADAVMTAYGVSRVRAQKLIHHARKAGFEIPSDAKIRLYDRAEIARVATAGAPAMGAAVAARFGVSKTHAHRLIEMARHEGFDIPRVQRSSTTTVLKQSAQYNDLVLVCGCGWSIPVLDGAGILAAHTRTVHMRRPSDVERTPQQTGRNAA